MKQTVFLRFNSVFRPVFWFKTDWYQSYIWGKSDTQPAVQLLSNDCKFHNFENYTSSMMGISTILHPSSDTLCAANNINNGDNDTEHNDNGNTYEGETSEHPPTTRTLPERSLSSLVSTPSLVIHTIPCVKVINTVSALTTTTSSALPPPTICILYVLVFYCNIFSHPLIQGCFSLQQCQRFAHSPWVT